MRIFSAVFLYVAVILLTLLLFQPQALSSQSLLLPAQSGPPETLATDSFQLVGGIRGAFDEIFADAFEDEFGNCSVGNWGGSVGLSDGDAGVQSEFNRRYTGRCGLRITSGDDRFLTHEFAESEAFIAVRFYFFVEQALTAPLLLFAADDGSINQIEVWYEPGPGNLVLRVFDTAEQPNDLVYTDLDVNRWISVEFVWEEDPNATILLLVDSDQVEDQQTMFVDTSETFLSNLDLGLINGAGVGVGNVIDFDGFDSRRVTRPLRLLEGDVNGDGSLNSQDLVKLINEFNDDDFGDGQPDCNEDGAIDSDDFFCVLSNILTQGSQQP